MTELIITRSQSLKELKLLSQQINIYHLELKGYIITARQFNPFSYLKVFCLRRSFATTLQAVCLRNFDISGNEIGKLCSMLTYLPNVRNFEFFRRDTTAKVDPLFLPNLLQVFQRPTTRLEAFAISKNASSSNLIFSIRDLYLLGRIAKHLKYFFCFHGGVTIQTVFQHLFHIFFSGVEQAARESSLRSNFYGISSTLERDSAVYLEGLLGEQRPFMENYAHFKVVNKIYRKNIYRD